MAQGRRVRLVVRRIEPLTVLRFSVLLYLTLYLVILVAGMVLWAAATATGLRGNVEKFIGELIASDGFSLLGATMAKASILGGAVLVVLGSGANVLFAVLYNLIADVVGGVVVLFEERPGRRRAVQLAEADERPPPLSPSRRRSRAVPAMSPPRPQPAGPEPPGPAPARAPQAAPVDAAGRLEQAEPVEVTGPAD